MNKPEQDPDDVWQDRWMNAVHEFASVRRELETANPWPERPLLGQAMNYLMTELWDRRFSQTEIRDAYNEAVADMPRFKITGLCTLLTSLSRS